MERQKKVSSLLKREDISVLVLWDREGMRNANIRYLTGLPSDAVLFVFKNGKTVLVPWDINLAQQKGTADEIRPFTAYNRDFKKLLADVLSEEKISSDAKIELPYEIPYYEAVEIMESFTNPFLCRPDGVSLMIEEMRQIKDENELKIIRQGAAITDSVIDKICEAVRNTDVTEMDIALMVETEAHRAGAEGTGFATIVAGPGRSCNIHAFPVYTGEIFIGNGLSLVDFGIKKDGYTTDVTVSFVKNPTASQKKMVELVEQAVKIFEDNLKPKKHTVTIANTVNDFFKKNGFEMPHALGHGLGLDIHEGPVLRGRKPDTILKSGMVLAVEPGIYSGVFGGVRLENDYLITQTGFERLTNSRIVLL